MEDWYIKTEASVRQMIQEHIGKDFDIRFGGSKVEIGLVEKYVDDLPCFYFGRSWDLYYGYSWFTRTFRFEMNHGTSGSFNLIEDAIRTRFVEGMGIFASSIEFLKGLRDTLQRYDSEVRERQQRLRTIREELENPFK